MRKKIVSKPTPIKPNYPLRLKPEPAQDVADYIAWMQSNQHVEVSINAAIGALVRRGWQAIQDAEKAAQQ